ncbi:uncharacterized protein MELLADRAFT_117290 [Melampsora larici-populina 98AG31]|uniref:Transmembrane protein 135 N-terminal domain-containing protein n=1 Tax=Melampsora larici-populina (strain 98AG31 / pathotype 3-4-7) TaxID=747676 RepID=F4RVH6_MELLP|nr:uncharacterized protein MELLADRAFT_117290 [Melampsora larici-populina 98AG31]EGG03626.1 hypothetical protein MELLADRAFT_117290 [Melampsora larici-populina 98AG31]
MSRETDIDQATPTEPPVTHEKGIQMNCRSSLGSPIPSNLSISIRSASQQALDRLQRNLASANQLRKIGLPKRRTSFIGNATPEHSPQQILQIAIKKWIFVFFSVQGVIGSGSLAFALLRKNRAAKRGEKRPLLQVITSEFMKATTLRLATFLALYSAIWTLTYTSLLKLSRKPRPEARTPGIDESKTIFRKDNPTAHKLMEFLSTWAASIAGGVSGLALLAQTKEERINLAPNVLCRGLYTLAKHRPLIKNFAYGDLLLFAISNAQIMSAFVMEPETLPAWYWHWIRRVGRLDAQFLYLHGHLNRGSLKDMTMIKQVLERSSPRSLGNERRLEAWLSLPSPYKEPFAPCHLNHPLYDNCFQSNLIRAGIAFKSMLPTYAILHLIPALLFRSKVVMKSFVVIILHSLCIPSRLYEWKGWHIRGSTNFAIAGFATSLALLWEDPRRRGELALYCAPKAISSAWGVLKSQNLVKSMPFGELALGSAGTAMLMHCFVHAPEKMPSLIRGIISQLVDPHTPDRSISVTALPRPPTLTSSPLTKVDDDEGYLTIGKGRK